MMMILTVDNMAKRYGLLPSEVLTKASTFDLVIMDASLAFERHVNKDPNTPPDVDESVLMDILESTRGNKV